MSELIRALDLKGATVMLDTMGCQREIAQMLVTRSADYAMGLKGNQGTPNQRVTTCFDFTEWRQYKDFAS